MSSRRSALRDRIAIGSWRAPGQGVAYGFLDLDVTEAEPWWRRFPGVSLTHVAGCAIARGLAESPEARGRIVAGRLRVRDSADVSFLVDTRSRGDLRSVCLRDVDRLHPGEAARLLDERAGELRDGLDRQLGRAASATRFVPRPLVGTALWAAGFVTAGLGRPLPALGLEAHPFGSFIVSSVGMLDIDRALAPILPAARVSGIAAVGTIVDAPKVVNGQVAARRVSTLGVSIDHRLLDGAQLASLARTVRSAIEQPWSAWPDEG